MLLAFMLVLAISSNAAVAPQGHVVDQKAACWLARQDATNRGQILSIRGTYSADWEYGSFLEPRGCDLSFRAQMEGKAHTKVTQYHDAFATKCHGPLMNDIIVGDFKGTFARDRVARNITVRGQSMMIRDSRFIITDFVATNFDAASVSCPR